jgi:hypothetical protein
LATALIHHLLSIADVEMRAQLAAVRRQESAIDLDRGALGAESLDLGLSLVVRAKAGFAAPAAAVVFWGIQTKKSVDRETT